MLRHLLVVDAQQEQEAIRCTMQIHERHMAMSLSLCGVFVEIESGLAQQLIKDKTRQRTRAHMMMIMMMMMIISPFGQLGLWAVTNLGCGHLQGCEMYSHKPRMFSHTPVIEESGHPR